MRETEAQLNIRLAKQIRDYWSERGVSVEIEDRCEIVREAQDKNCRSKLVHGIKSSLTGIER